MKKIYRKPTATVIDLHSEAPLMGMSNIDVDKSTDLDAGSAYGEKKDNIWNHDSWNDCPWDNNE